jgi:hypothetical protein
LLAGLIACGGVGGSSSGSAPAGNNPPTTNSESSGGTAAGTYSVTVTVTSGSLQSSAIIIMTVQ